MIRTIERCEYAHKRCYLSKAKARQAARRQRKHYGRRFWYQCPHCGYWHLTSKVQDKGCGR